MFPLNPGTSIIKLIDLEGEELVDESTFCAYRNIDDLDSELDLWDKGTTRFLLVDPPRSRVEDVTSKLAYEWAWHLYNEGWFDKYDPDYEPSVPRWAYTTNGWGDAIAEIREDMTEPRINLRLTKDQLL